MHSNGTQDYKKFLESRAADLDPYLVSYVVSYFKDETNEKSFDELYDFLSPILEEGGGIDSQQVIRICTEILSFYDNNAKNELLKKEEPRTLRSKLGVEDDPFKVKVQDVSLNQKTKRNYLSILDHRKLLAAEKRLAQKRSNKANDLYIDHIKWDLSQAAQMIVSQSRSVYQNKGEKNINLYNFEIKYSTVTILENTNISLSYGRRYGLIGKNGIGKSTLLMAIASGELAIPPGIRIQHIEQNVEFGEECTLDCVVNSDKRRLQLLEEEKRIIAENEGKYANFSQAELRLSEIYSELQSIDSDTAVVRARSILTGLGFSQKQQDSPAFILSGGWKMRLSIAKSLFVKHDLLLADEITNFLDFPAIAWLEKFLCEQSATLLIVSHDRSFLDSVATDIIHMHDGKLDTYKGNYTSFLNTRIEKQKDEESGYEAQMQYRQRLQAFVDRWRYNANRASQAQSRIKILQKLPDLKRPDKNSGLSGDKQAHFFFDSPKEKLSYLVQVDGLTYGYEGCENILENVNFGVYSDSRIAIVGPNGCGKSTLVSIIIGDITPRKGTVNKPAKLKIGHLAQLHADQLNLTLSPIAFLMKKFPNKEAEECRTALGRFGITGTTSLQPIATLSGGQKSRCTFTYISMLSPHLLILDEPTNHLDMDSIDALAASIKEYSGAVIIISHDEAFLDQTCNEVYVFKDKKVTKFEASPGRLDGVVKQYKEKLKCG